MPRVTRVKKCRKGQGACGKCGVKIRKGHPYRWWKFRYGGRRVRCMKPECSPRQSDLTSSDKRSRLYAAGEQVEDAVGSVLRAAEGKKLKEMKEAWEGLLETVNDAAQEIREVASEYEDSASNMEEHFPSSGKVDELRENASECEGVADELESVGYDLEDIFNDKGHPDTDVFERVVEGAERFTNDPDLSFGNLS